MPPTTKPRKVSDCFAARRQSLLAIDGNVHEPVEDAGERRPARAGSRAALEALIHIPAVGWASGMKARASARAFGGRGQNREEGALLLVPAPENAPREGTEAS